MSHTDNFLPPELQDVDGAFADAKKADTTPFDKAAARRVASQPGEFSEETVCATLFEALDEIDRIQARLSDASRNCDEAVSANIELQDEITELEARIRVLEDRNLRLESALRMIAAEVDAMLGSAETELIDLLDLVNVNAFKLRCNEARQLLGETQLGSTPHKGD